MLAAPPPDGADLWIVRLGDGERVPDDPRAEPEERARAARIPVPERRRGFRFRRAVQRHVLGRYLRDWRIERVADGKPRLAGEAGLAFSASSAGPLCAVAVARGEVGADIVAAGARVDFPALCARFVPGFRVWPECPQPAARAAAMWEWARLEAAIKLRGGALFDVLTGAIPQRAAAERLVAGADWACALARSVPFRLTRLESLPFAQVAADGG